jgi:hypothetical protein
MPKKLLYRLGEYRITDYENSRLIWERHVDFGVQRSGNGALGAALILGPGSHEEDGFLIGRIGPSVSIGENEPGLGPWEENFG